MAQSPRDSSASDDLVEIDQLGTQTDIVLGLLQSCGIPAVRGGRYLYSWSRGVVLVPRDRLDEAREIIRKAETSAGTTASGTTLDPAAGPRIPRWVRIALVVPLLWLLWTIVGTQIPWPLFR